MFSRRLRKSESKRPSLCRGKEGRHAQSEEESLYEPYQAKVALD